MDEVGAQILMTDVTKKGDCTQLKVAAWDSGAGIIVPMGLILVGQMDYAIYCMTYNYYHRGSTAFSYEVKIGCFCCCGLIIWIWLLVFLLYASFESSLRNFSMVELSGPGAC